MHQCILEIICIGYLKTSKKLYQTLHKAIFRAFEFDINSIERKTPRKMKWDCIKFPEQTINMNERLMRNMHD